MDGSEEKIIDELFNYANSVMNDKKIYPYVDFIVKNGVVISRGYNRERETGDLTMQGSVVAIRNAIEALGTGDLSGYSLYSFFEPTILNFDVAIWAGIKKFIWCINSSLIPRHYNNMKYLLLDYAKNHSRDITITNGVREKDAMKLVKEASNKHYYPYYLL